MNVRQVQLDFTFVHFDESIQWQKEKICWKVRMELR